MRVDKGTRVSHNGPQFYDDAAVFDRYAQLRARAQNANDTLEKPTFVALVGSVTGLDVLDLGCGDASFGQELLARGARSYVGVDGSANMVRSAVATLAGTHAQAVQADIAEWSYPAAAFDLVTARLVLHYVSDLGALLAKVHRSLRPRGKLVFCVEHPVITSCNKALGDDGFRQDWIVDDYFSTGERSVSWLGAQVVKHHRTIEDYFLAVQQAGFTVSSLRESRPDRRQFLDQATYERRLRIPLFLFVAAEKAQTLANR